MGIRLQLLLLVAALTTDNIPRVISECLYNVQCSDSLRARGATAEARAGGWLEVRATLAPTAPFDAAWRVGVSALDDRIYRASQAAAHRCTGADSCLRAMLPFEARSDQRLRVWVEKLELEGSTECAACRAEPLTVVVRQEQDSSACLDLGAVVAMGAAAALVVIAAAALVVIAVAALFGAIRGRRLTMLQWLQRPAPLQEVHIDNLDHGSAEVPLQAHRRIPGRSAVEPPPPPLPPKAPSAPPATPSPPPSPSRAPLYQQFPPPEPLPPKRPLPPLPAHEKR